MPEIIEPERPWPCECGHEVHIGEGLYQRKIPWQPWNGDLGYVCERCRQLIDFGRVLGEHDIV